MSGRLENEARQLIGKRWKKGTGTNIKHLSNIRSIAKFMETQSLRKIGDMKTKHVLLYFQHIKERGLAESTMQNHATAMRFLAEAIGKRNICPRTNEELDIVRHGRYAPKTADMEQQDTLREKLYAKDERLGIAHDLRESFGLRAEESLKPKIVNINEEERLRVTGKGGRVREIRIDTPEKAAAVQHLKELLEHRGISHLMQSNKTLKQVYAYQRNAIHRAGGTKANKCNMHSLRHNRVQKMRANGIPIEGRVQETGHVRHDSDRHY